MTRYGMAIDQNRCFGCFACAAACKIANNVPRNLEYNRVFTIGGEASDTPSGVFPDCELTYLPMQCQHCENAACVSVCPTGATEKQDNGIVTIDSDLCIGCEACIKACPYEGVRTLITPDSEPYLDMQVGEPDAPVHKVGTVKKCTFCINLIERDETPACMDLCPGRARYWGDLDDPESDVSKAIEGRDFVLLQEQAGTNPSVFYLQ